MSNTQTRADAAKRILANRLLARRRLIHFVTTTHGSYKPGWVHHDICSRLERFSEQVANGESPRLMLLMPPRAGKSELASIRFPAWHLGRHPTHEVIDSGYSLDLPMDFSYKVRAIFRTEEYQAIFPDSKLDPTSQSTESWHTTKGGGFLAAGVGGGLTGKGAHILIIDDPIKNYEDAESVAIREKLMNWFQSTAYTRLAPGGGVLLVQCMVGETPVMMADGREKRLDQMQAGDKVATYAYGALSTSVVSAVRSNGQDSILRITTASGRSVRCNERHPFLATTETGELKWIRARALTTSSKLVTPLADLLPNETPHAPPRMWVPQTGRPPKNPDVIELSPWHTPTRRVTDFTLDRIDSIVADGSAEVFDLQIEDTENFIANGLVSHNTYWHFDDLAGRLQIMMEKMDDADQYDVVKYPAISEAWEYRNEETLEIVRSPIALPTPLPENLTLLRGLGEALHPERYPLKEMLRKRANMSPRIWSALFQQNPVPDEGMIFRKDFFKREDEPFSSNFMDVATCWDFAISTKQRADWTVGATGIHDPQGNIHITHIDRFKGDAEEITRRMVGEARTHGTPHKGTYRIGVEDGTIWRSIKPFVLKAFKEAEIYPVFVEMRPLTDKLARARPLQGLMQSGKVLFPREAMWYDALEAEMLRFDAGLNDDQVDALSWMARLFLETEPPEAVRPELEPIPWLQRLHNSLYRPTSHMSA